MFSLKPSGTLTAYVAYEFPEETNPVQALVPHTYHHPLLAPSRLIFFFFFSIHAGPSSYEGKIRAKQTSLYEERKKVEKVIHR